MNFKERYHEEMNRYTPSAESSQRLQDALRSARKPKTSSLRRLQLVTGSVAVVCVALVAVMVVWQPWNHPQSPDTTQASSTHVATSTTPQLQDGGANYKNVAAVFTRIQQEQAAQDRQDQRSAIIQRFLNPFSMFNGSTAKSSSAEVSAAPETDAVLKEDMAGAPATSQPAQNTMPDFSNTNIQVVGVQEADIIKTDGHFIYALGAKGLWVISPNNGHPRVVGTVSFVPHATGNTEFFDIYLSGDRLIGLQQGYQGAELPAPLDNESTDSAGPLQQKVKPTPSNTPAKIPASDRDVVTVTSFDVSDPARPRLLKQISQSGAYVDSRMIGTKLYLVTTDYRSMYSYSPTTLKSQLKDPEKNLVPYTLVNGQRSTLKPDEISIYPATKTTDYAVASAIETSGVPTIISRCSILGGGDTIYASLDNLYVIGEDYLKRGATTTDASTITKIAFNQGNLKVTATSRIPGRVKDQFSLDEKSGVLRVVTTVENYNQVRDILTPTGTRTTTSLFCLDSHLSVVGKINDLAPNETVYSCRYVGDYAYFVTFREVDPLFTADLSDPAHPKLVGALKIPGFSEYLHPWSATELFGLGNTVEPSSEGGNAVRRSDLKIAMFDTSDPTDVKVKHELTIPGMQYSEASYDHHAILVSPDKGLIAFPAEDNSYLIYRYDESKGFTKVTEISLDTNDQGYADIQLDGSYGAYLRGLFINDYFYVLTPDAIASYRMPQFNTITNAWLSDLAR